MRAQRKAETLGAMQYTARVPQPLRRERRVSGVWRRVWLCAALVGGVPTGLACRDERSARLVARGDRELAAGQADAARASYEQALAGGRDVRAERGLGLALAALGRWDEAHPKLVRYAARQPNDGAARLALISVLVARGQLDEARKEVRMLTAKEPDSLDGLLWLGALAEDAAAREDALARLDAWQLRAGHAPVELTRCRDALRAELRSNPRQVAPKRLHLLQPCRRSLP